MPFNMPFNMPFDDAGRARKAGRWWDTEYVATGR